MKIEIVATDLKWRTYYKDDRCREVERILQKIPRYSECEVKREHLHVDFMYDPYILQDKGGEDILILEGWQIDALNASELILFVEVELRRAQYSDRVEAAALLVLMASILVGGIDVVTIGLSFLATFVSPMFPGGESIALMSFLFLIASGTLYRIRSKRTASVRRGMDWEAAREDPLFLEALRKLASVPAGEFVYNETHKRRLEDITGSSLEG